MNRSLEEHVLRAIVARWNQGERAVSSESVYNTLIAAGDAVPPSALNAIFQSYCGLGLGCVAPVGVEAIPQHRQRMVTDISQSLLRRYS
jgi:hypothetical protein